MSTFFIQTETGQVATRAQLIDAGLASADRPPELPWHPVQGSGDASTMWYAVLRKRARERIWIGSLVFRHTPRHASLLAAGWEEVPVSDIGVAAGAGGSEPA